MFFTKYPHPANFVFAEGFDAQSSTFRAGKRAFGAKVTRFSGGICRYEVDHETWGESRNILPLNLPDGGESVQGFEPRALATDGSILLEGRFGVSGTQHLFQFELGGEARFYGMGEKLIGAIELSGRRCCFYNTDVWSDFSDKQWESSPVDPGYFTTPYVIVKVKGEYVGLLLHNPAPTFIETPGNDTTRAFVEWQQTSNQLLIGAYDGRPDLWIIQGPTLPELTRKLQALIGKTPRPPVWALGNHQSRYGYAGDADLDRVSDGLEKAGFPVSGLWLDIDYMNGFRVFQFNEKTIPDPKATNARFSAEGKRVVPILDPGVKFEEGNPEYEDGMKKGIFCLNPEGNPFVGMVWPGQTVFPDFSMPEGRAWWTGKVKAFAKLGFEGCWVDMNDPSTGPVEPNSMLFRRGTDAHHLHRNQYALGMQWATYEGFKAARPNQRPFILSRSGYVGSSRYAAIWTGDNVSNDFHLKLAISTVVGLSISGQPFSTADVGGFGGTATTRLMEDWYKACFLYPVFRNHTMKGGADQEPYAYGEKTQKTLRHYVELRYRFQPYLTALFAEQERLGDPIVRPLFYGYEAPILDTINDSFLIGDWILQAPFTQEDQPKRSVVLPGNEPWFDARNGKWLAPGTHTVKNRRQQTPLFIRAGAIIPLARQGSEDSRSIDLLCLAPQGWTGSTSQRVVADDGLTFDYRKGVETVVEFQAQWRNGELDLGGILVSEGYGPLDIEVLTLRGEGETESLTLTGDELEFVRRRSN